MDTNLIACRKTSSSRLLNSKGTLPVQECGEDLIAYCIKNNDASS